ncbi:phosphoribosylanthranilate isomerase [Crassaminicella profunda]|uniref:phosphoribosylanthranilate isomerase n=1 Tax=Crassaminicella profunda TaxID=1286698 RepID=UPI001CA66468|nr:phosphoribosylanthranilate isomerase [Crassaminicella profunda]QZY53650.1 phosphoribosylanthranilate isomerase [Crassaminicella profunda]
MTKIKICGLKREEDIVYANKLKPDYVGFVFAKSSRQIDKYRAKELIMGLDKSIKKVGVFLNHSIDEVKKIAKFCELDILQFHGDEDPLYCNSFENKVWKAFRIKDENSLKELEKYNVDGFLVDTYTKGTYGGTGKVFNWEIVSDMSKNKFVILAGGLNPKNAKEAIEAVNPQVLDVSSGVEVDHVKNFEKMKKIIRNVRG